MKTRSPILLEREVARFLENCVKPQGIIAKEAGISQASVSRASTPSGRTRYTRALFRLCNYANIPIYESEEKPDPRDHPVLMGAIQEAWDGTEEHAQGLARVISELGRLGHNGMVSRFPKGGFAGSMD